MNLYIKLNFISVLIKDYKFYKKKDLILRIFKEAPPIKHI